MFMLTQLIGFGAYRRLMLSVYSFNMTAADLTSGFSGYSDGNLVPAGGSIDAEPIPGQTLSTLFSTTGVSGIAFNGDVTGIVAGLQVYIDTVLFPFDQDWTFDSGSTVAQWFDTPPVFVPTSSYFVEIK